MSRARSWRRYLRFWGPDVEADIDDELRFHLEARMAEYERLGHSPDEAARLTRERVGELTGVRSRLRRHDKQKLTIYRSREHMSLLAQDIRYGARKLRQAPGFTLAVVAVLALGIGANTAIYSAVDAAFFRPLPFPHAEQLVTLQNMDLEYAMGGPSRPQSSAGLSDARRLPVFSNVTAYAVGGFNLDDGAEPRRVSIAHVTTDFFRTMRRHPQLGRVFSADERQVGGPGAAILSHRIWQQEFGSDPRVIGRTIHMNGKPYTVVGVTPADFEFPAGVDLYVPLPTPITIDQYEGFHNFIPLTFIGRLVPGATALQAGIALRSVEKRFDSWRFVNDSTPAGIAAPLQQTLLPQERQRPLIVLMAAAALVLLIACANVANLLLARATTRRREMAIRSVLGATRGRILRQLTIESVMLSLTGAVCGAGLGLIGMRALRALLPAALVAVSPPRLDARLLAFTFAVALLVGLAVGIWPALASARRDAAQTIKAGGAHGATERGGRAARGALVVLEMALALVLLIGAGLMISSFRALIGTDIGIRTDQAYTARINLPRAKYLEAPRQVAFYTSVLHALRSAPGISAAGAANTLPLGRQGGIGIMLTSPESPTLNSADAARAPNGVFPQMLTVSPGYFAALGVPILRGRDIEASDDKNSNVLVVNKALADRFWPGMDPIGKHLMFGPTPLTVVGVVGDIRSYEVSIPAQAQIFQPLFANGNPDVNFVVRGALPPAELASRIRDAVHAVDPTQFVYDGRTMESVISTAVAPQRTNTLLLAIFGGIALALAAIGVYSVLAYGVSRRVREFGVRVALGAERRDVLRLVVGEGLALAGVGVLLGVLAAIALSRLIASILYQTSPHDLRIFVLAPTALMAIALAATLVPALRATRVDPMEALRAE